MDNLTLMLILDRNYDYIVKLAILFIYLTKWPNTCLIFQREIEYMRDFSEQTVIFIFYCGSYLIKENREKY